jgi:hypothetical protein
MYTNGKEYIAIEKAGGLYKIQPSGKFEGVVLVGDDSGQGEHVLSYENGQLVSIVLCCEIKAGHSLHDIVSAFYQAQQVDSYQSYLTKAVGVSLQRESPPSSRSSSPLPGSLQPSPAGSGTTSPSSSAAPTPPTPSPVASPKTMPVAAPAPEPVLAT